MHGWRLNTLQNDGVHGRRSNTLQGACENGVGLNEWRGRDCSLAQGERPTVRAQSPCIVQTPDAQPGGMCDTAYSLGFVAIVPYL